MRLFFRVLVTVLACGMPSAKACDVCGGSIGNQGIGLLPQFSGHFAGIQYQHYRVETSYPSFLDNKPDVLSTRKYTSVQAWGRYQLCKRIQLSGIVSYISNSYTGSGQSSIGKGIGDITLMANYALLPGKKNKAGQLLLIGAGLKLPTGSYTRPADVAGTETFSAGTGTGSWDIVANISYTRQAGRLGYNTDASYVLTTVRADQYKYGNRLNLSANIFYRMDHKAWALLPQAGVRLEHALHDYDHYARKWLNEQTGGVMCFISAGMQVQYRSLGVKTSVLLPCYQQSGGGNVHSGMRSEASLFLLF